MSDDLVLGIDEAGRGPMLGPLVLAGVVLDPQASERLVRQGVRDSKRFGSGEAARAARALLAERIAEQATAVLVEVVDVAEIDRRVARGELNLLEREAAAALIERAPPVGRIFADGRAVFGPLGKRYSSLVAVDHGEAVHAAVAAASLVAKSRRDQLFACIARRYRSEFGELAGGGYVNPPTRAFLQAYASRYHRLPPETRQSWPRQFLAEPLVCRP